MIFNLKHQLLEFRLPGRSLIASRREIVGKATIECEGRYPSRFHLRVEGMYAVQHSDQEV